MSWHRAQLAVTETRYVAAGPSCSVESPVRQVGRTFKHTSSVGLVAEIFASIRNETNQAG